MFKDRHLLDHLVLRHHNFCVKLLELNYYDYDPKVCPNPMNKMNPRLLDFKLS